MTHAGKVVSALEKEFAAVRDQQGGGIEDPHAIYKQLRRTSPVMEGDILARWGIPSQADGGNTGRPVFTLFKYDDIAAVMRDPKTYTSGLLNEAHGQFLGGFLLTAMDVDQHRLARNMLAPAFSPTAVARWRKEVEHVVNEEFIAPLTPKKHCDLIADVLLPAPVRLIYEIIGYPNHPEKVAQFATWGLRILGGPQAGALEAATDIYDHTLPIVQRRRAEGSLGDDLIGHMLRANYDDRTLTDDEIVQLLRQLLPAAAETTTRTFGNTLLGLLQRPALLARVRDDRTLVGKALDEGARWGSAAQFLARQCAEDVEIRGVKIPAGAALSLAMGSGNRDEEIFENPDEFSIDRKPRPHMGFGFGAHMCLGLQVAKMEMETMLNAMLDAWPNLRLDPAKGPPVVAGVQGRGPVALHVLWD